ENQVKIQKILVLIKINKQIMMIISRIKIIYLNKLKIKYSKNISNNKNNIFQLNIHKINIQNLMRQK
ncbi:hypothetical protein TTHERM_01677230, partial (macronuclear) [Tetrahymena thermophila SB210]